MAKRVQLDEPTGEGGLYLADPPLVETFRTGSTLLDCVLGGGHAVGGTVNIIGDKSTNKTGLATEAMATFHAAWPDAPIRLNDAEAAYDKSYARVLGCPESVEPWIECETFERFEVDFREWCDKIPDGGRGLYILDSLDSLSDTAEMEREEGKKSYGAEKAKLGSSFFRKIVSLTRRKKVTLFVVSQIRSNFDSAYGKQWVRAGGRAMDFYALQVTFLTHLKRLEKERRGVKRCVGIQVRAKNEKNKISMPFRDCEYPVIFNFGVDDVASMISWLIEVKRHKLAYASEAAAKEALSNVSSMTAEEWGAERKRLRKIVKPEWAAIEADFAPIKRKHG